ncbi:serine threonine kinase [Fusarium beomiforme]|uniref:Serine threonine kinase n=1 Tax=Fusarium beomiforme TaxID=44412 RepID=A0A9P5DTY6_9HYPO|nr:serine threonine kinase [Fusarium beomiforme]
MVAINNCYLQCSTSFSGLIEVLETPTRNIPDLIPLRGIENEHARFNVWAGSVRAKHSPHKRISLDYRLRDSNFYTVRVIDILQRLDSTLSTAKQVISGERPLFESVQSKFDRQRETGSDRSSTTSTSESSSSDEADILTPERQISALYESIKNSVRRLYSLAMVIRQPVATDRLSRASRISVDHFVLFDQNHVTECFPHASSVLKERLSKAITRRRQLLVYNEQHYHKSSETQTSEELTPTGYVAQLELQNNEPEQNNQPLLVVAGRMEYPAKDTLSHAPTISKGSLLASTEAIKFVAPVDMKEEPDVQSEMGTISTFGFTGAERDILRLPSRPQDDNGEDLEQFLCPLCYHLIEVKGVRAWTRHIFRDLQPYVCTFDNCEAPDAFFETRQDWIQHEFENHRREWHCNDPKHDSCGSEKDFIDHMRALHELHLPESQLFSLVKLCERPSSVATVVCPLCTAGNNDVEDGFERFKPSSIVRQISNHNYPESLNHETTNIAKLPEGSFTKDRDILIKVAPWVASLPNACESESNSTPHAFKESQQVHPTMSHRDPSLIPSSDLKRHIGQHLERLALFAINRSNFIPDDRMSAHTENAVARSESSLKSLQSLHSLNSDDESQDYDQAEHSDLDLPLSEVARFEYRYRMADNVPLNLGDILNLIENTLVRSEFDDETIQSFFSPEGSLESIITVEAVLWACCSQGETPSKIHSERLKSTIIYTLERSKKLFCILLLSGFEGKRLQKAIHLFREHQICDQKLPLQESILRNLSKPQHDLADRDHTDLPRFINPWSLVIETLWNEESINNFCNIHQLKFCAPVFSSKSTSESLHLHQQGILPFTEKCSNVPMEESYMTMIKYKIHEGHLESIDSMISKSVYVNVNRLSFEPMWQDELVKVRKIQALNQRHIINLITPFRRGEEDFYFICEAADGGNLKDFWDRFPWRLTPGLVKSVIEQLRGLAHAFSEVDLAVTGPLLIHGNLNPENIMWFKEKSDVGGKIGTLKTCHQSPITELVSREKVSGRLYGPPEQAPEDLSGMPIMSPNFDDTWAMGCITLEFLIWLLYGPAGLDRFHKHLKPIPKFGRRFWEPGNDGNQIHHVAEEWMGHMAKDPVCRAGQTAMGDLLELIRDRLLVVDHPFRNPVSIDLKDLIQGTAGAPEVKTGSKIPQQSQPIKRPRAQAKELADWMNCILTRSSEKSYWLPSAPLPPPDMYSGTCQPSRQQQQATPKVAVDSDQSEGIYY